MLNGTHKMMPFLLKLIDDKNVNFFKFFRQK